MNEKNYVIIDEKSISYNIKNIAKLIAPKKLYIVCKSDNYGLGSSVIPLLKKNDDNISGYCVSNLGEAIQLRKVGILKPIIILGIIDVINDLDKIRHFNFEFVIPNLAFFKLLEVEDYKLAHLALDVGLGRIGITDKKELDEIISIIKKHDIKLKGIYTHHSSTDKKVLEFECEKMNNYLIDINEIADSYHSGSSSSIPFMLDRGSIYRVGAAIFGMSQENIGISSKAVAKLTSEVIYVKEVYKGCFIGYNSDFECPEKGWVVNIPLGYGDGFSSRMKNFEVEVENQIGIVASVCMNQTMIFVKEKPKLNDIVILIGTGNTCRNSLFDMTQHLGIANDELFCQLSNKITRKVR